jgi:hypothetical protein
MRRLTPVWLLALGLAACRDAPLAPATPNTDLGLRVWAEVSPARVSVRDTARVLRIRVYVTNPRGDSVRVVSGGPPYVFTPDPSRSVGLWGSVRIGSAASPLNAGPNVDWWGDSVYVLPPRATMYDEYRVRLGDWRAGGWPLAAGDYRVRGWFNAREGASAELVLIP